MITEGHTLSAGLLVLCDRDGLRAGGDVRVDDEVQVGGRLHLAGGGVASAGPRLAGGHLRR